MAAAADAGCVFPEDIMASILTRLPVKPLARFKSVCKPWLRLLSSPQFIKSHHAHLFSDPKNESFLLHIPTSNSISLLNLHRTPKTPAAIRHPFSHTESPFYIIGSCHGLICLVSGRKIFLWNPALGLSKEIPPPEDCGPDRRASLGFGYSSSSADFKVVRLVGMRSPCPTDGLIILWANLYSANSDSWTRVELDLPFLMVWEPVCNVIVGGCPYWSTEGNGNGMGWFDVNDTVFKKLSSIDLPNKGSGIKFFDMDGRLGALVYDSFVYKELDELLHVWSYDDVDGKWRKMQSFRRPVNVARQLSRNGRIVAVNRDVSLRDGMMIVSIKPGSRLFVYDPVTEGLEYVSYAYPTTTNSLCSYTESLAYVEGMKPM
ncbi:Unknown protein [Striga hermonthica]|uniref:F-box domain-containing protein n=1 Tax=Striga hermonthica TaxID=68872 RepID=A0A9N7N7Y5_STRHE|nr:Unknown protein [Striga hermonthica]